MSNTKKVRYVVRRHEALGDDAGQREEIAYYDRLDLAIKHANSLGYGTCVDAQGGSYRHEGCAKVRGPWLPDWTNLGIYEAGAGKPSA